ncbi:glycosyltransferase family 2 protein [Nodosilinea sp. LEGE 07298]|uniref:glycosyltransferase family 2 protein n=1 Tax=Nodosilinea sp. LEGE 07298 TaxID=2777970 RepID=UPI001D142DA7|nr:glycosyltransferase family 2 protein [Nodosilinea sp. LEGE 07298]
MFSIFILTHDEERDIAACIESALLSDDVIVVDSCSRDRTRAIATQYPVRFVEHPFASHGQQRTWMLENVPYRHDWAYILEADERMTPELFAECLEAIQQGDKVGYYVAERVMFMGRWIRRSTQFPRYQLRLLQRGKVWFDDYGHTEREVVDGPTGFLQETYPHYTCSKGLGRWIDKHNRYSTDEAAETLRQLQKGCVDWRALFWGKSEVERRRALKDLSLRLPMRPLARWFYMMFVLGGWRDGRAGLAWCTLQAFYEYLIVLKVRELNHPEYLTGVQPDEDIAELKDFPADVAAIENSAV